MDLNQLSQSLATLKESQSGWASRVMWAYTAFSVVALFYMGSSTDAELQWRIFWMWGVLTGVYIASQKAHDVAVEIAKPKVINSNTTP